MIALQSRIMLVRIGEEARRVRNIEFPGCLIASRRDSIACVADSHSYALLDVEYQQKIPLFPISSSNEVFDSGHVEAIPPSSDPSTKRLSSASFQSSESGEAGSHSRNTSLNASRQPSPQPRRPDRSSSRTPDPFPATGTPRRSTSQERNRTNTSKDLPEPPARESEPAASAKQKPLPPTPKPPPSPLKPHIASPTPTEFLLVTGTEPSEPGVGMFVNIDGDVVRGTMEFQRYPEAVIIDGSEETNQQLRPSDETREGYVLAVVAVDDDGKTRKFLEVQRWDVDPGENEGQKAWVEIPVTEEMLKAQVGVRHTVSPSQVEFHELQERLRMVRLRTPPLNPTENDPRTQASIERLQKENELFEAQEMAVKGPAATSQAGWEAERNKEEAAFVRSLGSIRSSLIMWSGNRIWRVLRNPLTLQLDHILQKAQAPEDRGYKSIDRESIVNLIRSIRDAEPNTEAEYLGLNYVRQKASLLLFVNLISTPPSARNEVTIRSTEEALVTGGLDPRVVLLLIPLLRVEVLQGPQGIWVHGGLAKIAESYIQQSGDAGDKTRTSSLVDGVVLDMVKRYLFSWQRKRGYGSITDETYVFDSVDAALLHLLLEQDAQGLRASRPSATVRAELNRLVDNWKGNFDRAVILLEEYNRLFVLSRLYQSRKISGNVLKTWRRIAEGEKDLGDEVTPAGVEVQMRRYLVKIKDVQLVEEYGSWLAARNPVLGVQVFADDSSRVKLEPAEVVALLKQRAPNAVQSYLEHLVFTKNVSIHMLS